MLVNTIAFYPRPLRNLAPATVINDSVVGSPIARDAIYLTPPTVVNGQAFGSQSLLVIRRFLHPAAVGNGQSFGDNHVTLRGRTYLGATALDNISTFGSHRFTKKLLATAVSNASAFGAHSIAVAEKKYSYANTLGAGNRAGTIVVTLGGVTAGGGSASQLVNGSTASEFWWNTGTNATLKFDFGAAKAVKQARWKQSNSSTHGTFKWQGSNDDASYTDIGGTFPLGGATTQIHTTLIDNETAYRYYRLVQTAGTTSNSPYLTEVEFFIDGATADQPDTCYLYACGGGVDAGGQSSGTGGNGVSRTSLITVTGSFTPPDGTLSKLVDGQAGNNSSQSTDFVNGLTNATITFDFQPSGKKHVVTGITWEQNNSTGQGNYDWEASNDNANWTTLQSNFSLVNGSSVNETTWTSTTAYRYHRLKQVSGSTSSSPWIHEIYFKCAPGAYAADAI